VKRREFITLMGGAAAWPLAARAQEPDRMRRIGVLTNLVENDPEGQARDAAFLQGLQQLGWTDGRNVRIDIRRTLGDTDRARRDAAELVALAPDVILTTGSAGVGSLLQATRTVPIVFVTVPIRSVLATSIAWRGRAATRQVLRRSNTASARNGWNCSSRLRRAWREWQSSGIPPLPSGPASTARSSPWHRRSGWS
jgi:putative ABC transport system substrate-binding protein